MPRIIYGTAWKKERTTELVLTAIELGWRGIDTAGQPKHYREDLVGVVLRQAIEGRLVTRDQLFVQSKFTSVDGQDPSNIPYDATAPLAEQVRQSAQRSLSNLSVDYLDSLLLHSPLRTYEATLTVWRALEGLAREGVASQLGISNCYDLDTLTRLYDDAEVKPAVVQNRFYAKSGYDVALRAFCRERNIVYQSFWTLSANPHLLAAPPLRAAAKRLGCSGEQALFKFVQSLGIVPLSGTTDARHMADDLGVFDLPELTDEERGQLAAQVGERV